MFSENVQKWMKRSNRNAPYYLFAKYKVMDNTDDYGYVYTLIWKDKSSGKVKLGTIHDGAQTWYGFQTWATLNSESWTGFWQQSNNSLTEDEGNAMIAVYKGESKLPIFELNNLKNLI